MPYRRFAHASVVAALVAGAVVAAAPGVQADQAGRGFNSNPITIPSVSAGVGTPYPSTILMEGMTGVVTDVRVHIDIAHTHPEDLDILLVGPGGQNLLLMSDAGGSTDMDAWLTFTDSASQDLPEDSAITTGAYRPKNYGGAGNLPTPAPPTSDATTFSVFHGTNPNGVWSLYVSDDADGDGGSVSEWQVVIVTGGPAQYHPVTPVRMFDTRSNHPPGAVAVPKTKVLEGTSLKVKVTGAGGVPENGVGGVSLNVTATGTEGDGYVSVYPCTSAAAPPPPNSSVNFRAGQTVANAVITQVSTTGEVCFRAARTTHLVADVNAWFGRGMSMPAITPERLFDTRPAQPHGLATVPKQKVTPSTPIDVSIAAGVIDGTWFIWGAVLNVTVNQPEADGYLTVYPRIGATCGDPPPTSSVNFRAGQTVANSVVAAPGDNWHICVFASSATHVIADISGLFTLQSDIDMDIGGYLGAPLPERILDTRPDKPQGEVVVPKVMVSPGVPLQFTPSTPLPVEHVDGVVLNVTATRPGHAGYLTVYPCGPIPLTSNVNFLAGQTVPNSVVTPLGPGGSICIAASTPVHVIVDLTAWFVESYSLLDWS